ncbi:TRAP transporter substrate-binding protein DctP [Piscinibacter sakaiensis]|uniref:TRAP transporter substrate-binding protein DctP n=1 Tax=Piscinibacter sakaiensis TaxID=1547922 RepID=UPI003AAEA634
MKIPNLPNILCSAALLALAGGAASAVEPIRLDLGNFLPSTHHLNVNAYEPWKKMVEEKTQNRVKVNLHHGGVLGGSRAVIDDVKGGVYQVGLMIAGYYYDTPLFKLTIGELPFAISGPKVGAKVMTEFTDKYAADAFEKIGVKNMGVFTSDPYVLMSSKPIRNFADMHNKKVRVPGKAWVQISKDWGAVPLPMKLEEVYSALERGTLDVLLTTPGSAMGYKFYETAPYVTQLTAPVVVGGMIMNKSFYDALPADLKKQFDQELNPALLQMITNTYDQTTEEAYAKMRETFKAKGQGEIIALSSEERLKFVRPTAPAWTDWVEEANKRGYPGEEMMGAFKTTMKKHGLTSPF